LNDDDPLIPPSQSHSTAQQFYVKPYVARKQRFDRWARRRSLGKINALLDRVHYSKAVYVVQPRWTAEGVPGMRGFVVVVG
jgi:hypothetical protein